MKIIFLDIDGVLNGAFSRHIGDADENAVVRSWDNPHGDYVELSILNILRRIIEQTGAKVVITSSWAHSDEDGVNIGIMMDIPTIDKTWCTGGSLQRGESVLDWIDSHDVESYIIIDDAGHNMYESYNSRLWSRMIHTNGRLGMQPSDEPKAVHMLSNPDAPIYDL